MRRSPRSRDEKRCDQTPTEWWHRCFVAAVQMLGQRSINWLLLDLAQSSEVSGSVGSGMPAAASLSPNGHRARIAYRDLHIGEVPPSGVAFESDELVTHHRPAHVIQAETHGHEVSRKPRLLESRIKMDDVIHDAVVGNLSLRLGVRCSEVPVQDLGGSRTDNFPICPRPANASHE
jgi:hypothetical protein